MVIFQNLSKNGEMLKNVGENIKQTFALIFFYTLDIKNITFNPKFYQHFLPSLLISIVTEYIERYNTNVTILQYLLVYISVELNQIYALHYACTL